MYSIRAVEKKGIEREIVVALPRLQYRVEPPTTNAHTPYCKPAQPKMATAIFGFGRTHAPEKAQWLDRKNTIVGKVRGKAATMHNKQFGSMAGVARFITRWLLVS